VHHIEKSIGPSAYRRFLAATAPNNSRQLLGRYAAAFFRSSSEQYSGLVAVFCYTIAAGVKVRQRNLGGDISFFNGGPQ
jgi:hypothetical protein